MLNEITALTGKGKVVLKGWGNADESKGVFFLCSCKSALMDRLLVLLFSVTMLLATAAPKVPNLACAYSKSKCIATAICTALSGSLCSGAPCKEKDGCGKGSGCPLPVCCVSGPGCCLCIVPERPLLHIGSSFPEEELILPNGFQDATPQQVYFSIWKPPAFSV
jgi:hypothetical protein